MTSLLNIDFGLSVPGETNATATGSTQADAYFLRQQVTVFSVVASGAGAILPGSYSANASVTVANRGANDLMLYPGEGDQIEGLSIDAPFTVAAGSQVQMVSFDPPMSRSPRTWWIMGLVSGIVHVIGGSIDGATIGASIPSTGAFTSLTSQSGALNGTIGATTPNTGAFTSVEFNTAAASRLWSYVTADTALEYTVAGTKMLRVLDGGLTMGKFFATDNSGQALGAGGYLNAYGSFSGALSGTKTAGSNALVYIAGVDTLASTAGGLSGLRLDLTQGGTGAAGSRVGVYINQIHHGNLTAKSLGYGNQIGGLWSYVTIDGNFGGTAGNGNSYGSAWGGIASIQLNAGATYMTGISGLEVNMGVGTGASAVYVTGAAVVMGTHRQATSYLDSFLSVGATVDRSRVGLGNLIGLGSATGYWGLDATGDVMQLIPSNATLAGGPLPYTARNGINLTGITFSGSPFLSTGFAVSPAGVLSASALATGGTTARTLAAIFADQNNVKSFGAAGDGTTVDLTALYATSVPAYLPNGVFYTGNSIFSVTSGRWAGGSGGGRLQTLESGVSRQGPRDYAVISSAPVTNAGWGLGGLNTIFDADYSRVHNVQATKVSGASTLGTPTTGFALNPATGMGVFYLFNQSGHNESLSGNDGRTGLPQHYYVTQNNGQGDMAAIWFNAIVGGTPQAGATSYLANAAVSGIAGTFTAQADGIGLKPIGDLNLVDGGHDVTGHPFVTNMYRTNGTGAIGVSWMALRPQSVGSVAIDGMYCGVGLTGIGIDFTGMIFQDRLGTVTNAAATLKANMRQYMNATNPNGTKYSRYTVPGTEWYEYDATLGHSFVVGSASVFNANATAVTASKNLIRKAATADQSADVYAATAAGSRTIPNGCSWECLTPAATIATFTTTMPAAPIDKQEVWISTTQTITTWTLSANTGQTINGAPTTLLANTSVMFRYNLATTAWFRMV